MQCPTVGKAWDTTSQQLLGNISSSIAKRKTQCLLISLLPDTGAALAVQQFLALRLVPQDSEKNQRHI